MDHEHEVPEAAATGGGPVHGDLGAGQARWLGLMFAAAALLSPTTLLLPHGPGYNESGIVIVTAVAAVVAISLLLFGRRPPPPVVHGAVALGALLTTAVIDFTAGLPNAASLFFVWIVLFAFYFFDLGQAVAHMTFVLVLYAFSAMSTEAEYPLLAHAIATGGTLVGSGVIVAALKRRIEKLLETLSETARTDELTGLPNRRAFNEELARALARATRAGEPLALVVLDLDHFKEVNDRFGHPAGDDVLRRVSSTLRRCIRVGDLPARIGGEEFAVIFPGSAPARSHVLAERVREALAVAFAEADVEVTASVGVADANPADGVDAVDLVRTADKALYEAKRGGRNRVVVAGRSAARVGGTELGLDPR